MLFKRKWQKITSEVSLYFTIVDKSWQKRTEQLIKILWIIEKNTEKNMDRTRGGHPTPAWSSQTILMGVHKDFSEWDPHSPAICSRLNCPYWYKTFYLSVKQISLIPVSASCSDQDLPGQDALILSSSHQITHKGARSFTTDLQVFLGPLGSFQSCWSADFELDIYSLLAQGNGSQGDAHSSTTVFWHWAAWVRHNFHFILFEHLRKL